MSDDGLVDALTSLGVPEEEAVQIRLAGRAPLVVAERLMTGDTPHSFDDVVDSSGIDRDLYTRWLAAVGVDPAERFSDEDVDEARLVARLLEFVPTDAVLRLGRLRRLAAGQVALGDVSMIRDAFLAPWLEEGTDEAELARRVGELTTRLWPAAGQLTMNAQRRAVVRLLRLDVAAEAARSGGQEVDLSIGFVDLVGYTRLSAQVDPTGLGQVLEAFEQRVFEVLHGYDGVTLAKMLGDAAMVVSTDLTALADALLDLVDPVEALEEAPLCGGMAAGPVIVREGDYFGEPVNAAARLTDAARPWSLLASQDLADALGERYDTKRIPPLKLKGLGRRRPLRVRRPEPT